MNKILPKTSKTTLSICVFLLFVKLENIFSLSPDTFPDTRGRQSRKYNILRSDYGKS